MTLKNRFIRAAIGDYSDDGTVTEKMLDVYRQLAEGGVGVIITGFTLVGECEGDLKIPALYHDRFIDGQRLLVDAAHASNTAIVCQLAFAGAMIQSPVGSGMIALGPSAVANLRTNILPREISNGEIQDIQQNFAAAALRAKISGYDGIELHGAHSFLFSQFLTPYYNHRNDAYGGTIENRARMLLETYGEVRKAVGEKYPIWVKLNCDDFMDGGITFDDCLYSCRELAKAGVDAIEVSGNLFLGTPETEGAYFKEQASRIAAEIGVSVILTGGNRICAEMTELLNSAGIDYFGMAIPFMTEPDIVNRFKKESRK
jgi:2,4-dienoyl-CoA reductase-like NADH-dependent reductase (Old Yellow Enzyme family)